MFDNNHVDKIYNSLHCSYSELQEDLGFSKLKKLGGWREKVNERSSLDEV